MNDDAKHSCSACPVEVRGLYAAAYNAIGAWERGDSLERVRRRMDELSNAIDRMRPIVDEHFAAPGFTVADIVANRKAE